ncbi:MAG: hypothetical protein D6689_10750 [Deltaproteobacteria bacterium]|nr:MAG: hypothetical protein D6689_10750 [Deltaproteobacteria bacterium]
MLVDPIAMRRLPSALIPTRPRRLAFAPRLERELAAPTHRALWHAFALMAAAVAIAWFAR